MKRRFFVFFFLIFTIVLASCSSQTSNIAEKVTVFKSASCGCCGNYVSYLKSKGFSVSVVNVDDISSIKMKHGIPLNMESCHTVEFGDYFIEGHVPIEAVNKLILEKPDIKGIMLPGMPSASPGMPGSKMEPFEIYALQMDGGVNLFMRM